MNRCVHFVYRCPYEGPMGKRHVKLRADSILAWFQKGWDVATSSELDLYDWVEGECQVRVYGLNSIFEKARKKRLPKPATWQQLHELLRKYLYVEGGPEYIQQNEFSLRVRTDDDENDLAYYFIEEEFARAHPEIVSYILLETENLAASPPEEIGNHPPVGPFNQIEPSGSGEGILYICFLVRFNQGLLDLEGPFQIKGIRLPEFTHYLKSAVTGQTNEDKTLLAQWPWELRYIRAFTGEGDENPAEALQLCGSIFKEFFYEAPGIGPISAARAEIERAVAVSKAEGRTQYSSLVAEAFVARSEHFVQLSGSEGASGNPTAIRMAIAEGMRLPSFLQADRFMQWYIFDDVWAAEHPRLALSLIRYCSHWDPLH